MPSATNNPRDKLVHAIEALDGTKISLHELIDMRADKVGRMEKFEEKLRPAQERLNQFRSMAEKHEKQSRDLEDKLKKELARHMSTKEKFKAEIDRLKREIEMQKVENEQLEKELKENVEKLQRREYSQTNGGTKDNIAYANTSSNTPETTASPFISRLRNELGQS